MRLKSYAKPHQIKETILKLKELGSPTFTEMNFIRKLSSDLEKYGFEMFFSAKQKKWMDQLEIQYLFQNVLRRAGQQELLGKE